MSHPEELDQLATPFPETLGGFVAVGRQCVELARLSNRLIEHASEDIADPKVAVAHLKRIPSIKSGIDFHHPTVNSVIKQYATNYYDLATAYRDYPDDQQLYEAVFNVPPRKKVTASRFAGGAILSCEGPDYITAFRSTSSNPDRAEQRARKSGGAAFGLLPIDETGKLIPVGATFRKAHTIECGYNPHSGRPTRPLKLDELQHFIIKFSSGQQQKEVKVAPQLNRSEGQNTLAIQHLYKQYELGVNHTPITGEKQDVDIGPYRLTIETGNVTVAQIPGSPDLAEEVRASIYCDLDEHSLSFITRPFSTAGIRTHELQHLINDQHTPRLRQVEGHKEVVYTTEEELVSGIAKATLRGKLDRSIWNEFLAKIAGGRGTNKIVDVMAREVEQRGVLYDYVSDSRVSIVKAATKYHESFPDYDSVAKAAEAKIRTIYREHLETVGWSITEHAIQSPNFEPLDDKQIVSLLAPHAFHRWPAVLRAVNAYAKTLRNHETLPDLLQS